MSNDELKSYVTQRGFHGFAWSDIHANACSVQKSSLAGTDAIWLGYGEYRMHLSRQMVRDLIPILQKFADTGDIFTDTMSEQPETERRLIELMDRTAEPILKAVIALLEAAEEY